VHLLEDDLVDYFQDLWMIFMVRVSLMLMDFPIKCSFQVFEGLFLIY